MSKYKYQRRADIESIYVTFAAKGQKPVTAAELRTLCDIMCASIYNGRVQEVAVLLQKNVDPNEFTDRGFTPLMYAAISNHADAQKIARMLLDAGADASLMCDDGKTAIDYAKERGNVGFIEFLKSYAAEKNSSK